MVAYMLNESFFYKKFSIGLAMHTDKVQFINFLEQYKDFIDNIYVSLPLGDRFHGREPIQKQFQDSSNVTLFWELLTIIRHFDINIEVAFNTNHLDENDFRLCREHLDKHDIDIQKVVILDWYFKYAKKYFPKAYIVKSVNNMPETIDDVQNIQHPFDEIVIGRQNIRNEEMFSVVASKAKSILLLNNGCSHECGGCKSSTYCREVYRHSVLKSSAQYIYAMQSILPYEIHEGYFDISKINLFKISNRNADTEYTAKCIDSYIHNNAYDYIVKSKHHYMLWARLGWHIPYFDEFEYGNIMEIKKSICNL